jgi:hypothetical protein
MAKDISDLVKAARAAREAHRKSMEASKAVAAQIQAESGYGRPAESGSAGGAQ